MKMWISAALLALLTAGCGGGGDGGGESAEKDGVNSEAVAKDSAQAQLDAFSGGDYAGAWARLDSSSQDAVPEADYVAISEACSPQDFDAEVTDARISGENAVVHYTLDGEDRSAQLRLEDDEWRWVLGDGTVEAYSQGVDQAISALVNAGAC